MATIYVRSTDGSNADNGSTWALAKATLAGADAIDTAGDTIYVSQVHAESTAASVTLGFAGSATSPTKIIGGNDAAQPPTALSSAWSMTVTGSVNININGSIYCYGGTFTAGATNGSVNCANSGGNVQVYESCSFILPSTNATAVITTAGIASAKVTWLGCNVKFGAVGQGISIGGNFTWRGGAMVAGSSTPTALLKDWSTARGINALVENVDLSAFGAGISLSVAPVNGKCVFRNCKLPASWSGTLLSGSYSGPGRLELYNCDNAATNYRVWIEDFAGTIRDEETIVKSGGASDGVTPISWKLTTPANVSYPVSVLETPELARYYPQTAAEIAGWSAGMTVTVTVDILRDSATNLKDNEIWLDVNAQGTASFPLGVNTTDMVANVLTTAADQTASTATWANSMSNPNKQKLSVTVTLQQKGWITGKVILAKPSVTALYVDPKLQVA